MLGSLGKEHAPHHIGHFLGGAAAEEFLVAAGHRVDFDFTGCRPAECRRAGEPAIVIGADEYDALGAWEAGLVFVKGFPMKLSLIHI